MIKIIPFSKVFRVFSPKKAQASLLNTHGVCDSVELSQGYKCVRAKTKAEREAFGKLFLQSLLGGNASVPFEKAVGFIFGLAAKLSPPQIIKDANGKILGGFSCTYFKSAKQIYIGQLVVDSSLRGTKEGKKILVEMGRKIKTIAADTKATSITCNVDTSKKSIIKLYEKAGFVDAPLLNAPGVSRLKASVDDFGKGYL